MVLSKACEPQTLMVVPLTETCLPWKQTFKQSIVPSEVVYAERAVFRKVSFLSKLLQ